MAALVASGCATYTMPIQRDVTRGDIAVHVEQAAASRIKPSVQLTLVVRQVPEGVRLLGAALTSTQGVPCETGYGAQTFGRDKASAPGAPLVPGERISLKFPFPATEAMSSGDPYLELWVESQEGQQRCVPIPLTAGVEELEWSAEQRWAFGSAFSLEGFTSRVGPITQVVTASADLGAWVGGFHLEAGGGLVGSGCPEDRCQAPSEDMRINYSTGYALQAGVLRPLWERGEFSIGATVRYRTLFLAADTFEGRETLTVHNPVVAPYIGGGVPIPSRSSGMGGAREGLAAVEMPIGYAFADNGERSFTIGASFRLLLTVL